MKCEKCGKDIPSNSTFCTSCGNRVGSEPTRVCKRCGEKISKDQRFCLNCGAPSKTSDTATNNTDPAPIYTANTAVTPVQTSQFNKNTNCNSGADTCEDQNYAQAPNFYTSQQSKSPTRKKISFSLMIKIAALVCAVIFFFPLCTVSCSYGGEVYEESLSGLDCTVGKDIFDAYATVEAKPASAIIFIIPVILFILAFILKDKINPVAILIGIAQITALLIFRGAVIDYIESEGGGVVNVTFTLWYVLDILSAGASSVFGLLGILNIKFTSLEKILNG